MTMWASNNSVNSSVEEGRSTVIVDRGAPAPGGIVREVWQVVTPGVCRLVASRAALEALVARHPDARLSMIAGRPDLPRAASAS